MQGDITWDFKYLYMDPARKKNQGIIALNSTIIIDLILILFGSVTSLKPPCLSICLSKKQNYPKFG